MYYQKIQYIAEAAAQKQKYEKKFKCCYCEGRYTRNDLPNHIQKKHEDLIPEGYTALRVAFNTINKKTEGHCIICQGETAWNEIKGRYERLCGMKSCKDEYIRTARERVKNIYGTDCILKDPRYAAELQKKMLASRKISGNYRFQDGGVVGYTGTYEKKCLEFLDKIMHVESTDILSPGPIINYRHSDGQIHMYISDFLYIPYNLIIEVKDGGKNPNNRPMDEYREKQLEKEKAVREDGKYNYLRLTDNDFGQLMEIMAILKISLMDDPDQRIIKVNEMTDAVTAAIAPSPLPYECDKDNFYIIQHLQNNVYNYSITKDPTQAEMLFVNTTKKKIEKGTKDDLSPSYITFKLKDQSQAMDVWKEALQMFKEGTTVDDPEYFYYRYIGKNILVPDQIFFDESCSLIPNFDSVIQESNQQLYDYLTKTKPIDILKEQMLDLSKTIGLIEGE